MITSVAVLAMLVSSAILFDLRTYGCHESMSTVQIAFNFFYSEKLNVELCTVAGVKLLNIESLIRIYLLVPRCLPTSGTALPFHHVAIDPAGVLIAPGG